MSHEIEADFVYSYHNEEKQCRMCASFDREAGYCSEARAEVPADAHCDFFQAID